MSRSEDRPENMNRRRPDREAPPGRSIRPAYSRYRRTWYGYGRQARVEKSRFGCVLDDATYAFGDVSLAGLPVLFGIMVTGQLDVQGATLSAWATMVLIVTVLRGGWIRPLATETRGWVSVTPSLILLRVVYYNLTLFVATYGGFVIASSMGLSMTVGSFGLAVAVGAGAMMAFPRLAERYAGRLQKS